MSGDLTLGRWIIDRARTTPGTVAIDFLGELLDYRTLEARSAGLAAALSERGVQKGDRVAVLAGNHPDYAALMFACARAGFVIVPLNWRLTAHELAYQISDSGPSLVIADGEWVDTARDAIGIGGGSTPIRLLSDPTPATSFPDAAVHDDDPLMIVYTSGTTGKPKGAVLSHANCFWTNLAIDRVMDVTTFDVVLQVLPQFHVGGWNVQPLLAFWKGATVVLEPSFDPERALRLIEEKRVTTMMGVPATYLFMAQHPNFAGADVSSLRAAVVGGAPMPESLIRTWHDRGVTLIQGYGLTEAAPNVLGLPAGDLHRRIGYAGKPYPHVDVALQAEDGAIIDGPGTGELLVRGPSVFTGYWENPEATAEAMRGGWLHTGDVAERDHEGFYRIRDRVKDMYISGGENVYPAEVESTIHEIPGVIEAAVLGVHDERWGETGLAVVAVGPESDLTADAIIDYCRERLARFKVPGDVVFVDSLPRSGMGKVLKRELAQQFEGER